MATCSLDVFRSFVLFLLSKLCFFSLLESTSVDGKKALTGFEPVISCLLDRYFNR